MFSLDSVYFVFVLLAFFVLGIFILYFEHQSFLSIIKRLVFVSKEKNRKLFQIKLCQNSKELHHLTKVQRGWGQIDKNLLIQVDYLAHPVNENTQNTPHNKQEKELLKF